MTWVRIPDGAYIPQVELQKNLYNKETRFNLRWYIMNKNIIIVSSVFIVVLGVLAIAQIGNSDLITGMIGYKMTKSYNSGTILGFVGLKLIAIALVSFIFSVIFWYTNKWVMAKNKKKK